MKNALGRIPDMSRPAATDAARRLIDVISRQKAGPDSIGTITDALLDAFRLGMGEGIRTYATWSHGEQFVGALSRPLRQVLDELSIPR